MSASQHNRTRKETSDWSRPPDHDQRKLIFTELDRNMLVEAAAGTGKTTSMIGRMVALLREDKCDVAALAAVTFTRKAAAELRERFQLALERAARTDKGARQKRLEQALTHIERCFIGTIHSFCARLLRERPVEAGVDIAFQEIEPEEDTRLRKEAWDQLLARLQLDDSDGLLAKCSALNLPLGEIEASFMRFADYPDVDGWPFPPDAEGMGDLTGAVKALLEYVDHMKTLAPSLPWQYGADKLIPAYRLIPRIVSHYDNLHDPVQLTEVLARFDKTCRPVQREWATTGTLTKDDAKAEEARWNTFREETVAPLLQRWRECCYEPAMRVMFAAKKVYDDLRRRRGQVNYQDLLMKAATLLRSGDVHVRRYFRRRFTHLLVDEFQDTDPVQAEVMLLLTADDPAETDWRRCAPAPGALFVVGDPKQSIYRFRRADILTYNTVRRIIARKDAEGRKGLVVQLSANFRTISDIVEWVNSAFAGAFPGTASDQSPAYVPLQAGRTGTGAGDLVGVRALRIPKEPAGNKESAIACEADMIARTIRHSLDAGLTVARTRQEIDAGIPPEVSPGDFLIVSPRREHLSAYAAKLQEFGIPHQVTGGAALNEVEELKLLHACLVAVVHPDDPVALLTALRGELFGISDTALYAFKKAGGEFSYKSSVPGRLPRDDAEVFRDAFDKLTACARWLSVLPPVAAIESIVAELGLMAMAGARAGGDVQAGSLAKAIEVLRSAQRDMWSCAQLVEYLGGLIEREETYDGISALSPERSVVRVMNLHKAKGLEAPIVFLAGPTGERKHPVETHIDRFGGPDPDGTTVTGFMTVCGEQIGYQRKLLAQPAGWAAASDAERAFLDAEAVRLRYVAATRAGSLLSITQRDVQNKENPWKHFAQGLEGGPDLPDPRRPAPPDAGQTQLTGKDVETARARIRDRLDRLRRKTYDVWAARDYAVSGPTVQEKEERMPLFAGLEAAPGPPPDRAAHGAAWGTVVHQLLQLAMDSPDADLEAFARAALPEHDLDTSLACVAADAARSVMRSDLWSRALAARERFTEIPFQIPSDDGDLPVVLRGVIDLAFQEDDGWVLVDYKTDPVKAARLAKLAGEYAPQLQLYADCWRRMTGQTVKEQILFFSAARRAVPVPAR